MQVNAYEYDADDNLRCMARHINPADLFDSSDRAKLARVLRDLRSKGVADIGGGAAPHFIVLRVVPEPSARQVRRQAIGEQNVD